MFNFVNNSRINITWTCKVQLTIYTFFIFIQININDSVESNIPTCDVSTSTSSISTSTTNVTNQNTRESDGAIQSVGNQLSTGNITNRHAKVLQQYKCHQMSDGHTRAVKGLTNP